MGSKHWKWSLGLWLGMSMVSGASQARGEPPKVGEKAPAFSVPTVTGGKLTLKHENGRLVLLLESTQGLKKKVTRWINKVVFIDFWATWCPPCRAEIPHLEALHKKYGGKNGGLVIIGVSVDREIDAVKSFIKGKISYLTAWGMGSQIVKDYGLQSIPAGYIIDPQGIIRHVHIGFGKGQEKKMEKEIQALLPPSSRTGRGS